MSRADKKKAEKRGGRSQPPPGKWAAQSANASAPRGTRWPLIVMIPALVIAAGVYLISRASSKSVSQENEARGLRSLPSEPPTPALTTSAEGVPIARLDHEALVKWCRSVELPIPPAVEETEPIVAETMLSALRDAAVRRDAATLGRMGQICESLNGHRSAEEYFRMAAEADPRDYRWPYYLGCIAQVTGRTEEAAGFFLKAREINPEYPVTYARLAQLYLELERDTEAAAMSQQFASRRPRDWLGFVGLGRVALRRGDYPAALRFLTQAVERGPQDFQSHYYLAKTYAAMGDEEKARQHFATSAKLPRGEWFHHRDPLDQDLHRSIDSTASLEDQLEADQKSQDWPRLASIAERIVERRPSDVNMMCNLASFYRKLGRYDDAHKVLDRAAKVAPETAAVYLRSSEVYLAQSKPNEALAKLDEAAKRTPPDVAALSVRGRVLFLLKRHAEAEEAMRQALDSAPDNPGNQFVLGEILHAQGRSEEAARCYRRVLELRPEDGPAKKRLGEIEGTGR